MNEVSANAAREAQIDAWLERRVGPGPVRREAIAADASARRYFRVYAAGNSFVLMDAPSQHEDCRGFMAVARLLHAAGLNAPQLLHTDPRAGLLLLSDLGRHTYLDRLDEASADGLMDAALDALVRWQRATRPGALPPYDAALLRAELDLFPEWYLGRHLAIRLEGAAASDWEQLCALLVASARAQPRVFVHRDYMPRNLMVSDPLPGIIDFQDAVIGPVTYDLVSLLRDAFISWDEERERRWIEAYWAKASRAGVPLPVDYEAFLAALDLMGVQRHLKVLGIFARLRYRDGKARYLEQAPRFGNYLAAAARRRSLPALCRLLERIGYAASDGGAASAGATERPA